MRLLIRSCFFFLFIPLLLSAQPKREFRGAWIATVTNIDWPTTKGIDAGAIASQKQELITLLDSLRRVGVNAVIFQIRPACDALYQSAIEPWSQWLTGTQGLAPSDPLYDPLSFAISESRKRGMEFHAWFNPYRAVRDTAFDSYQDPGHVSKTHSEWIFKADRLKMLNPGLPQVREYVTSVILDVVRRYDIDAVHFDDYFYPYSGMLYQDSAAYADYGGGAPLGDWRRQNVNILIRMIRDSIALVKSRVKFGISPFGIWKNAPPYGTDPNGSLTNGLSSHDAIYADSRGWMQEGWVDYLAPQVYWYVGYSIANYGVLVPWWNSNSFSRHLYIGQATYKMLSPNNWPVEEIADQISMNRDYANVQGSIHFSAKYFRTNTKTVNDSLRLTVYSRRALVPRMAWKDTLAPNLPDSFKVRVHPTYVFLDWQTPGPASDGEIPQQYIVYKSTSLPIDYSNMSNVLFMGFGTSAPDFVKPVGMQTFYYAVTALDRNQNESQPTAVIGVDANDLVVGIDRPGETLGSFALRQNFPNPFNPATIVSFFVPTASKVTLTVYDVLGREIDVLMERSVHRGEHRVQFNAAGLASGVYFYRLRAIESGEGRVYVETKKMQVVK